MIVVDILTTDAVSYDAERLNAALQAQTDILEVASAAGERVMQDHFQERDDDSPNRRGFSRKHFWAGLAAVTGPSEITGSEAVITIHDPAFNMKVYGGDIYPKRGASKLAVPETDRAYQAGSPREGVIADLFLFHYRHDGQLRAALATGTPEDPEVQYWLMDPPLKIFKDPHAMPADEVMHEAIDEALEDYFEGMGLE